MANVVVRFIGDATQLQGEMRKVEGSGNKLKTLAKGVATAVGGAFAIKFAADAVKSAEQLQSTMAQVQRTFGASRASVEDWAKGSAERIGQSETAALAAAQGFGVMARGMGIAAPQAAKMSTSLVDLAANLAAAKGVPFADALNALQTGLKGRATALKGFGISIDTASIKAEAMRLGLVKTGGTLTAGAKAQAAYSLIIKQGGAAHGAYAKFAGTAAGQQQKLKAEIDNARESIGSALLPVLKAAMPFILAFGKTFANNAHLLVPLAGILGAVAIAVKGVGAAQKIMAAGETIVTAATWLWNAALDANPIVLIIIGIAALVAGLILAYQHFSFVRDAVNFVWQLLQTVFHWIVANWPLLLVIMFGPFGLLVALVIKNFGTILGIIEGVFGWIVGHWQLLLIILTGPIGLAVALIVRYWKQILEAANIVWQGIKAGWNLLTAWLGTLWRGWQAIFNQLARLFHVVSDAAASVWNGVRNAFNSVLNFLRGILGGVSKAATAIGNAIKGPINLVIGAWNDLKIPAIHLAQSIFGKTFHFDSAPIDFPNIPKLAAGGIVTSPTLALVGERGPEAVVPLSAAGYGNSYSIDVHVSAGADPAQVGRAIVDQIRAYEHAYGARWRAS